MGVGMLRWIEGRMNGREKWKVDREDWVCAGSGYQETTWETVSERHGHLGSPICKKVSQDAMLP